MMHGDGDDCWRLSEQDRRTRHVVRSMAVAVRQGRQRRTTPHQLLLLQSPRITMLGARNSALLTLPAEDTNATCHCLVSRRHLCRCARPVRSTPRVQRSRQLLYIPVTLDLRGVFNSCTGALSNATIVCKFSSLIAVEITLVRKLTDLDQTFAHTPIEEGSVQDCGDAK